MQLTPKQINEFVAKAVLESQIGEAVQSSVSRVIQDLQKNYDNQPAIEAGIKEATEEVLKAISDSSLNRLKSRY